MTRVARIAVLEPVPETRELMERLITRAGHEIVVEDADVVVLEPLGGVPSRTVRMQHPRAVVVVASIVPARPGDPPAAARLLQPFASAELRRAIDSALAEHAGEPVLA